MTNLGTIARARTGDKGNDSIIGVYCSNQTDFSRASEILLIEKISKHFGLKENQVSVTPIPALLAYTVLVRGVLDGGVTRSLRSDPHGKTLGSYLLEMKA
jgi:hypothetical protein